MLFPAFCMFVISMGIITGCKKDKKDEPKPTSDTSTTAGSRAQLTTDSIFLYAKDVYLWNTSLPSYDVFNPRQYVQSDEEAGFNQELFKLTRYAINSSTGLSYEYYSDDPTDTKYSYIFNTDNTNPVAYVPTQKASVDLEGNGYDIGILPGFYGTDTSYVVLVKAVYNNSPAEKAGLNRGDVITTINGKTVGSNYSSDYSTLYNAFFATGGTAVSLKGYHLSNKTAFNVTLTPVSYKSNPVYCDSVYTSGSKKIGYLCYARFSSEENSVSVLNDIFSKFSSAGVTDLIIDLRYNGGGYVTTAQHLVNLIAPSSTNGDVMFSEHYNSTMQSGKASILSHQPQLDANNRIIFENGKMKTYADLDYSVDGNTQRIEKAGALSNINNVVFIVTGSTASASELVINSLKPYLKNMKIVGETSYGKPVGFFPIHIDKYDVYFSMFETENSEGGGKYYSGFTPDKAAYDDPTLKFGVIVPPTSLDTEYESLYTAWYYLVNGAFPQTKSSGTTSSSAKVSSILSAKGSTHLKVLDESRKPFPSKEFRGMIENRKLKQKNP